MNRPVHLARRDVYFEKASQLILAQNQSYGADFVVETYEEMLFMLRTAREHARFSIRDTGKNSHDEQFSLFINLLAGNVKAVLAMINLKGMIENAQGSSFGFLGDNQATAGLQVEEYHRRANDIVRSMQNTLHLAEEPFKNLKAENRETATDEENLRYEKARQHFFKLAERKQPIRRIPSVIRKFLKV